MFLVGSWSAGGRRKVVSLGVAAALCAATVAVSTQAQDDPHKDFRFAGAGMIVWQVPADTVAEFDGAWSELLSKLSANDKPDVKELASTIKIYRPDTPVPGQLVSYFIIADPSSKTLPYSPVYLVYESGIFPATPEGRKEADALFAKMPLPGKVEGVSISALPLAKVGVDGAAGAASAPPMAPSAPPPPTTPPSTTPPATGAPGTP